MIIRIILKRRKWFWDWGEKWKGAARSQASPCQQWGICASRGWGPKTWVTNTDTNTNTNTNTKTWPSETARMFLHSHQELTITSELDISNWWPIKFMATKNKLNVLQLPFSTFVRTQRFCVTGAFSMWRLKQSERPINHSTFITVGGRRGALWRSWLIPWEGFCIEPVQVFWLAHKNDPHNWQRLLCFKQHMNSLHCKLGNGSTAFWTGSQFSRFGITYMFGGFKCHLRLWCFDF